MIISCELETHRVWFFWPEIIIFNIKVFQVLTQVDKGCENVFVFFSLHTNKSTAPPVPPASLHYEPDT